MALGDFFAKLGGGTAEPAAPRMEFPTPPKADDIGVALDRVEAMVTGGAVPSCVTARVERVTHVVRDTIPRLESIKGSANAYSVMATATDYLPEALGGYLRLPRRFADSRPVDGGKTSLMVLVDQLDLLGATMDQVFDAVCRDDATALVAHGRFLTEKFGHASSGGVLDAGAIPTPVEPALAPVVAEPASPVAAVSPVPPVAGETSVLAVADVSSGAGEASATNAAAVTGAAGVSSAAGMTSGAGATGEVGATGGAGATGDAGVTGEAVPAPESAPEPGSTPASRSAPAPSPEPAPESAPAPSPEPAPESASAPSPEPAPAPKRSSLDLDDPPPLAPPTWT